MMKLSLPFAFALLSLAASAAEPTRSKYAADVHPLSARTNQDYFKRSAAPDFWKLIPYYIPQDNAVGCSAANLTMLLNAARDSERLGSDDALVTFKSFIEKYAGDGAYQKGLRGDRAAIVAEKPFANLNLVGALKAAAEKLGVASARTKVEAYVVDQANKEKSRKDFLAALAANEKSADDFIFFSFVQGTVTGDPEGGAHVATVGAYDAKKGLVLVLDPDREYYEPYWAPVDKLFAAIADPKSDSQQKAGWIHFKVR